LKVRAVYTLNSLYLCVLKAPSLADVREASQIVLFQELLSKERECFRIVYETCQAHVTAYL